MTCVCMYCSISVPSKKKLYIEKELNYPTILIRA